MYFRRQNLYTDMLNEYNLIGSLLGTNIKLNRDDLIKLKTMTHYCPGDHYTCSYFIGNVIFVSVIFSDLFVRANSTNCFKRNLRHARSFNALRYVSK